MTGAVAANVIKEPDVWSSSSTGDSSSLASPPGAGVDLPRLLAHEGFHRGAFLPQTEF